MKEKNGVSPALLGMWTFLASEMLFFSTLILMFWIYRYSHPQTFEGGVAHMYRIIGTINTAVLLTSSWTMARAVVASYSGRPVRRLLSLTAALGALFVLLKFLEYYLHYKEGLFPGLNWDAGRWNSNSFLLFFLLYYVMTGLHALHLLIGIACVLWVRHKSEQNPRVELLENVGLYWHFVDLVWVFLFPMFYLIGRTA